MKPASPGARIPSLDGLRAISILFVLAAHEYESRPIFSSRTLLSDVLWLHGSTGVSIFFVISGFLITGLLLREEDKTGRISLRKFYIRRVFRILPPFYAYAVFVLILGWLGLAGISVLRGYDALWAMLFTWDYNPKVSSWLFAHTWSLSIEEQFYLLWPATLVVLGRKKSTYVAAALIVAAPALRILTALLLPVDQVQRITSMLHTRVDMLMFGCLLALMSGSEILNRLSSLRWPAVAIAALFPVFGSAYLGARFGVAYLYTVGYTLEGLCIATVLI